MNIHEYQGKALLKKYGVAVPRGFKAQTLDEAKMAIQQLKAETDSTKCVVKAQIHAGGRGKGGGVKLADTTEQAMEHAKNILGMQLITPQTGAEGKKVHTLLIEENVYAKGEQEPKEYYMGMLLDRTKGQIVIMASTEGGMDIEEVAHHSPDKIVKEWIDPAIGLQDFQARKIAFALGMEGQAFKDTIQFVKALYKAYTDSDASMVEINPMLRTSNNRILAADCKISLDENALYRHPDLAELRDLNEEDPFEVEAKEHNLNYVKLDGNVGCMVNGAGLAMATMDIIKLSGGDPANFLDVGGGANAQTVEAGFRIILKDPNVKAILINIFGGIVRCDRVANGVVEAYKNIGSINIPIIVRLQGTNAEEAAKIIDSSGLKVVSAIMLKDAALKVKEALQK